MRWNTTYIINSIEKFEGEQTTLLVEYYGWPSSESILINNSSVLHSFSLLLFYLTKTTKKDITYNYEEICTVINSNQSKSTDRWFELEPEEELLGSWAYILQSSILHELEFEEEELWNEPV